jgi:hypothetical protein
MQGAQPDTPDCSFRRRSRAIWPKRFSERQKRSRKVIPDPIHGLSGARCSRDCDPRASANEAAGRLIGESSWTLCHHLRRDPVAPQDRTRREAEMQKTTEEVLASLTELHAHLAKELKDLKSGEMRMYAGGSQLRDVTTERISSLEWRVPKLKKTIAAYREGIKDLP